jgi:hypothetical protein
MKQPVRKQPSRPAGLSAALTDHDVAGPDNGGAQTPRYVESVDATVTLCGWCRGPHATAACPRGPRLSAASVVLFALEAFGRGGRVWA